MSEKMYKLRDMLCEELDKITDKGTISRESLELIDKLTHSIKSIDTIMAMEEAGYSEEDGYSGNYYPRYSYARGRGRNAKRDSMGRYSRDGRGRSYDSGDGGSYGYNGRRYSREDGYSGDDEKMQMLQEMMNNASDSRERDAIKKMMEQYGG